jgi:four helix bundle protein
MKKFEDLEVYQKSLDFTVEIFQLTEKSSINVNIKNQLERAALSIPNNISEGFELQSNRQFVKFLYYSKGSSGECRNILNVIHRINQIDTKKYNGLKNKTLQISKQLANFIKYLQKNDIN